MGNMIGTSSDQASKSRKDEMRNHVHNAQDSFVRRKVEEEELDDYDDTSIKNGATSKFSSGDDVDADMLAEIRKYPFPFENLVFEGGGNKGLAFCGAIKVLEELDMMRRIKRYAGASAGAMTAALLAVGYSADEIREFLSQDLSQIFIDHSYGYLSLLPNLLSGFGWNPGTRIFQWFGENLAKKTGNPDITFYELYKNTGKELCIVVTNLNMMDAEYCHPKTSPDLPIRMAVRMSMAIPGLFQAINFKAFGQSNWYVDGGVLNNYPINCFDGWWLSMDRNDSFLSKLYPLENYPQIFDRKDRFGTFNKKTIGFLLYADTERDVLRDKLEQRQGAKLPKFPQTKLGIAKLKKKKMMEKAKFEHGCTLEAVNDFLKVLQKHNINMDEFIDRTELEEALQDEDTFPKKHKERLFGSEITVEDIFDTLDENKDGKINYQELIQFVERTGISLQRRFVGYQRKEIEGVFSFFDTIQSTLVLNVKRSIVEDKDVERTVGINTGHVDTTDFVLESEDREFAVQQGRTATESFLSYYVKKYPSKS
ncbi:hypothetical protein CHS0354_006373 [Potamilus streckersoni]|uniref:Calmodulin n=1 Tax=Potamilus streckersoni TaxID=2493646 RepID=A0AAE0VUN3_9BIVA|nr:hypothetical protein CHS0354_006373 [Potamilus streckersoni]